MKATAIFGLLSGLCCAASGQTARAETFPTSRPIILVVPFSAGTGVDQLARVLADRLSKKWGTAVVVEDRPGASTLIGTSYVAKAAPDGYTLLLTAGTLLSDAAIHHRPDPTAKFTPVISLTTGKNGFVVGPRTTAKSIKDIESLAKASPGKLLYSAAGTGSVHTLAMELFKYTTGTDIKNVFFRGADEALNDVVAGRTDMMTLPITAAAPFIRGGQVHMLAVLSNTRSKLFPDVPTMAEAGYPKVTYESYYFLLAPDHTPADVVQTINTQVNATLKDADFGKVLDNLGLEAAGGSSQALGTLMKSEFARLVDLVQKTNMHVD